MKEFDLSDHGGISEPTIALQNAIDAAYEDGGGLVRLPADTLVIGGITIRSRVILEGAGESSSILRLENGCNTHVIQTENFDKIAAEGCQWLESDGMPHGFGFRNFRIEGNRVKNNHGIGIAVYGKRYTLDGVLIAECAGDGMVSQGPDIGGQQTLDDVLEVAIGTVRIHRCRGNGLVYRGPHDGYIASAIIGSCNATGFISDTLTGKYNGAVDIGRIHAYGCGTGVRINTTGTSIQRVIGDANRRQGVIVDAHRVQIGQLWAFRNWRTDFEDSHRSEDARLDSSVELNQACQIGVATVRTDFGGTGIRIKGSRTQVGSCHIENESPLTGPLPGIGLDVQATLVRADGHVQGYSVPGSIGVRVSGEKYLMMTRLDLTTVDCHTGFVNECDGDSHRWTLLAHTNQGQTGFRNTCHVTASDIQVMARGHSWQSWCMRP